MNELPELIRQHYEKNEAGASLLSKVTKILDFLPAGSVDSLQLAGSDQFHVMGLAATEQPAQIAGIERGATILDAGSGLGGPSRYLLFGMTTSRIKTLADARRLRDEELRPTLAHKADQLLAQSILGSSR